MQADFYPKVFQEHGLEVIVPSAPHQAEIDAIIFGELVINNFTAAAKRRMLEMIAAYDVDGVILGCTELPLLITPADCPVPVLDTLTLHAEAALDYALGDDTWNVEPI